MLERFNFEVGVTMMPSGEKLIKCRLDQPKMFMRTNILLMIGEFFSSASPEYKSGADRPNFYSSDSDNASRQEIILEMREALICFENEEDSLQTLACQGSLILTKTRETLNQIKIKLLDRHHSRKSQKVKAAGSVESGCEVSSEQPGPLCSEGDFDYSAKTAILLFSLTDFCP